MTSLDDIGSYVEHRYIVCLGIVSKISFIQKFIQDAVKNL